MTVEVTKMLSALENGDRQAASQLLPLVYDELRKLATHRMSSERATHTLQPTALCYMKRFSSMIGTPLYMSP